jgi:hypothetical protein
VNARQRRRKARRATVKVCKADLPLGTRLRIYADTIEFVDGLEFTFLTFRNVRRGGAIILENKTEPWGPK